MQRALRRDAMSFLLCWDVDTLRMDLYVQVVTKTDTG